MPSLFFIQLRYENKKSVNTFTTLFTKFLTLKLTFTYKSQSRLIVTKYDSQYLRQVDSSVKNLMDNAVNVATFPVLKIYENTFSLI